MGGPISPIIANITMDHLFTKCSQTVPAQCKPRLAKKFVDDSFEICKKGRVEELTDHMNRLDPTGSLKFTYEEEQEGKLAFLDTLVHRQPDGTLRTTVYRKKTHTDQYLHFQSHHPLHQKQGVIRTLIDRADALISEPDDRKLEMEYVT